MCFCLPTTHFLQAARWSFARLGILGVGLVSVCKHPAQTATRAAPLKPVFLVFLVFSVAAHPKARKPQTVSETGVARKPQGFIFCASRLFMRFAQVSAAHLFKRFL